ncbi:hypothetical protein PoB_003695300 [Plakobranchus ocellatus]|uniref:Uncharacterized protein n=1 Tax=Plakobranchus ocellatus TaxID=259542 RepID=A0AAV4ASU3_9GAST|nr:hypothetical protein PoB_003695300 [Plakobranchus ocellatus]
MSFLDPFVGNPTTKSNLESFGSQADSRSLDTPIPSNVIQIAEQDEQDEITMTQEQPHNFKRQPDNVKKDNQHPKGKKVVLQPDRHGSVTGIERAGKEEDTDGYWWRGLKPTLNELDPIESLKFNQVY